MHRRVRRLALIGAVVATLAIAAPVGAITNGQADDGEHPQVGELFFYVPSERDDRFTSGGSKVMPKFLVASSNSTFSLSVLSISTVMLAQ